MFRKIFDPPIRRNHGRWIARALNNGQRRMNSAWQEMTPIDKFKWVYVADLWDRAKVGKRYEFLPTSYRMKNYEHWYFPFDRLPESIQRTVIVTLQTKGQI